jgi:hypothetical protein
VLSGCSHSLDIPHPDVRMRSNSDKRQSAGYLTGIFIGAIYRLPQLKNLPSNSRECLEKCHCSLR